MNIYPVQNKVVPNFKASFIHNEISRDLIEFSSKDDVAEFNRACEALENIRDNHNIYYLSGSTTGYGFCSQAEVEDKFIGLNYKTTNKSKTNFVRNWSIRGERVVSGGYEKRDLLKEVAKQLRKIASEEIVKPVLNLESLVLKKASFVAKAAK